MAEEYDDLHIPRNAYSPTASKKADDLFPNDAYGGALWTSTAEEDGAAQREEEDAAAFFGSSFAVNADYVRSTTARSDDAIDPPIGDRADEDDGDDGVFASDPFDSYSPPAVAVVPSSGQAQQEEEDVASFFDSSFANANYVRSRTTRPPMGDAMPQDLMADDDGVAPNERSSEDDDDGGGGVEHRPRRNNSTASEGQIFDAIFGNEHDD